MQGDPARKNQAEGQAKARPWIWVRRLRRFSFRAILPKGLWTRTVLIVIIPILVLQFAVGLSFLQNYWTQVTERLSRALVADIAFVIELHEGDQSPENEARLSALALEKLKLNISFLEGKQLPNLSVRPFFALLDRSLSREIIRQIDRGFWLDTVGRSNLVEIRIALEKKTLRVIADRQKAYAVDSIWFIVNMLAFSFIMILLAIIVLRNQVKPIVELAEATERFGRRGESYEFQPRGAREIRQASLNFIRMRERIERFVEERTNLLSGISHDLRTVLTRFRLNLALMPPSKEVDVLVQEVEEMKQMLNAYLSFAREMAIEDNTEVELGELLTQRQDSWRFNLLEIECLPPDPSTPPLSSILVNSSFGRVLDNVVSNAARFAQRLTIKVSTEDSRDGGLLLVQIDDDGPGIEGDLREKVFMPFYQLKENQVSDEGLPETLGLGLAITRDIIRSLGGKIELQDSALGGLAVSIALPLVRQGK